MADPIKDIVATENTPMPSQDDPANYQWWADWHEERANGIAATPVGSTQGERLGQLQGELDHRATADSFRSLIQQEKDPRYGDNLKQDLIERGVLAAENKPGQPVKIGLAEVLEDTRYAFGDYGIPEEVAEHAVMVGRLTDVADAGEREAFYTQIMDAKSDLDELMAEKGTTADIDGINDWKSAIDAAGIAFEKRQQALQHPANDPDFARRVVGETRRLMNEERAEATDRSAWKAVIGGALRAEAKGSDVRSGLATASQHWTLSQQDVRLKFPLLTDNREAEKIASAGRWRAALIARIPVEWQRRLGLDPERTYNNAVDKAYVKVIDQKRDALLSDRTKALTALRGVDSRIPPHLLPSKQYRAAERLTQIDQQLRTLSPLDKGEYGAAISAAVAPQAAAQLSAQAAPERSPERAQSPAPEKASEPAPSIPSGPTKHELALQAVRDLRAQTPVDGYRSKAAEAMANRIVQQLQEGRETVSLSAKYAGGDQGQATSTHANAVEANKQLIEAVRGQGIAVDTGRGSLATAKKAEVELNSQVEQDLSQQNL